MQGRALEGSRNTDLGSEKGEQDASHAKWYPTLSLAAHQSIPLTTCVCRAQMRGQNM